jgi:hypothetical protein
MCCQEPKIAPERCRHRLDVRTRVSLGLGEHHSPDELGIVLPRIIPEARKQLGDHAAVAVDRALRYPAMMSQPILELGNVRIDHSRDIRHGWLCDAALDQEANKPAHTAHVFCRHATMLTAAAACTAMPGKLSDDAFIDITNRDLRAVQPLSKVTGAVSVSRHCQSRMPKAPQLPGELLHKRPQAARIHTLRTSP